MRAKTYTHIRTYTLTHIQIKYRQWGYLLFQWHLGQLKDQHRQQQQDTKQYRRNECKKASNAID